MPRRACGTAHADHVTLIARANQKDQPLTTAVIARRTKPDVAIRIPCNAKHCPSPIGAERERIATGLSALAMTW